MNYIIKPIKPAKQGFYKVYLNFDATDSEINNILFENKLRFIRKDKGLFSKYKVVILAEKI